MIRSGALGDVLSGVLNSNDQLRAVVLQNTQGTVLDSREIELEQVHEYALPVKVQTELYAVLAAQAWKDGRKWTGIDLSHARLCIASVGRLLLLIVADPGTPWGYLNELLDSLKQLLEEVCDKVHE